MPSMKALIEKEENERAKFAEIARTAIEQAGVPEGSELRVMGVEKEDDGGNRVVTVLVSQVHRLKVNKNGTSQVLKMVVV